MKKKNISKKLNFTKQTIAALDADTQGKAMGGTDTQQYRTCGCLSYESYFTDCDRFTDCYAITACWTNCANGWAC